MSASPPDASPKSATASQRRGRGRSRADGKLLIPGFVNAHYHSHDILLRGCFENLPTEIWFTYALPPAYPQRSAEEVRARTLLAAAEAIRNGVTTLQDMLTIAPLDPELLDVALEAYDEAGLRVVMAQQIADLRALDRVPFWRECVPAARRRWLTAAADSRATGGADPVEAVIETCLARRGRHRRIGWALGPTNPLLCSPSMMRRLAAFSATHELPVVTHFYQSRAEILASRRLMAAHGGSLAGLLEEVGPAQRAPRACAWHLDAEPGSRRPGRGRRHHRPQHRVEHEVEGRHSAAARLHRRRRGAGARIGQFRLQRLPEHVPADEAGGRAGRGRRAGAGTAERGRYRALRGPKAAPAPSGSAARSGPSVSAPGPTLVLLDLRTTAFVPLNSAARQMVFAESGAAIDTVIVDGRILMAGRTLESIDRGRALSRGRAGHGRGCAGTSTRSRRATNRSRRISSMPTARAGRSMSAWTATSSGIAAAAPSPDRAEEPMPGNVTVVDHPLVQHKLTLMRRKEQPSAGLSPVAARDLDPARLRGDARPAARRDRHRNPVDGHAGAGPSRARSCASSRYFAPATGSSKACSISCPRRGSATSASTATPDTLVAVEYYYKVPADLGGRPGRRGRSDAGHRQLRRGGGEPPSGKGGAKAMKFACLLAAPEGYRRLPRHPSRSADLRRQRRRAPERPRLHRPRHRRTPATASTEPSSGSAPPQGRAGPLATTPSSCRRAISPPPRPRTSARISSVCSPSAGARGGGRRGAAENSIGEPGVR